MVVEQEDMEEYAYYEDEANDKSKPKVKKISLLKPALIILAILVIRIFIKNKDIFSKMSFFSIETNIFSIIAVIILIIIILSSLRIYYEYERGVLFTLGKFTKVLKPGLRFVIPILQQATRTDMRLNVVNVPEQNTITKDNVSINVSAVLYFRLFDAQLAIIKVEDYFSAVSQLAQTTMRNVIGEVTLDELLSKRDQISKKIEEIVDKATDPWGVKVVSVDLKHIELPEEMKTIMAKAAEAERLKRAIIIESEGEALAAKTISKAAEILSKMPGAMHLRTLQSLTEVASDASNKVNFFIPLEIIKSYEGYKGAK